MSQPALKVIDGGQKDRRALLRELYAGHGGSVYERCHTLLKDAPRAEEAMLAVFARALRHADALRAEASPRTWLMRTATHHCLELLSTEQAPWQRWLERLELTTQAAMVHSPTDDSAEAQTRLEAKLPFERFASGVEQAEKHLPVTSSRPRLNGFLVAVAAMVLLAVAVRPLLTPPLAPALQVKRSGATAELRIAGEGGQPRPVTPGATEALAPGERVRLGYMAGPHRYVLAVSVDAAGELSPLYPEEGASLPAERGPGTHWLPDSLVFAGSGHERVVVVLSEEPLTVAAVRSAARRAFEAGGRDVAAMPPLGVGGEETHWLLRKPTEGPPARSILP